MLRIVVSGANGRMGRALTALLTDTVDAQLVGATENPDSDYIGLDVGELAGVGKLGLDVVGTLEAAPKRIDVVIDFSSISSTLVNAEWCAKLGVPIVIGTTGLNESDLKRIELVSKKIPICMASNFSIGVNLIYRLVEIATVALKNDDVDIEVFEAHHKRKLDAPSGTALSLGQVIANSRGQELDEVADFNRKSQFEKRSPQSIGFSSIRGGDIVGNHTVFFAGEGELVEITHRASSRMAFARGALRASRWLIQQPPGIYDMEHVLEFS
ncbi:MAG: 4-hydroxy-tetrahydrodipicolinate reductase [Cellvibrionales bacterium TMED49]|nr:4-hydroxy-tetrahydrodipicolinate reductase [Porticoccaceae bacterium]OUU37134.1 MAG: 4-hydroxy-tetrahydrodipicolinate reductase [Cellvibrionales bacterium TMED49]